MLKLSPTARRMAGGVLAISGLALLIGLFFTENALAWVLGIFLGAAASLVKILLLERAVNKVLDMPPADAQNYMRLQYLLRYVLTGGALALAALTDWFSLYGAAFGVLAMPLSAYLTGLLFKEKENPSDSEKITGRE